MLSLPLSLRHSFLHPQNFRSGFVRVHCACDTVLTLRRGGGQQRVFNSIFEIVFMLTTHSPPGGPSARRPGDPFFRCPFLPLPPSAAAAEVYSERMRSSVRPSVRPWVSSTADDADGQWRLPALRAVSRRRRAVGWRRSRPSARCLTKIHHDYVPWRKAGNKRCNSHSTALHCIASSTTHKSPPLPYFTGLRLRCWGVLE